MEVSSWESHLEMVEFPSTSCLIPETSSSLNRTLPKGLGFLWTVPGCQEQVVVDLLQDLCMAIMPLISSYEDSVMTCQFLTKWRQKQKCCDILMLSATILWDFNPKDSKTIAKTMGIPAIFPFPSWGAVSFLGRWIVQSTLFWTSLIITSWLTSNTYIWVNYNISLTWILRPFGMISLINHDSSEVAVRSL